MIGETILHYPLKADQPLADKILEKLGEGGPVRPSWLGQAETGRSIYLKIDLL